MIFHHQHGVLVPFAKKHFRFFVLAIAGIFVFSQVALLLQPASAATASVSSQAEFETAIAGTDDTIELTASFSITSQLTIDRPLTIEGNGFTIDAAFTKTDNSNNSAIGIQSDNVTINDLILTSTGDAPWPLQLHGVNIYTSNGVVLSNVSTTDFEGTGILVNGSSVTASNLTTSNNGWHGINVDQGGGVTQPAVLNISNYSIHNEILQIYLDNVDKDVTVNDIDGQYLYQEFDNLNDVANQVNEPRTAGLYTLDPERFAYSPGNSPNLKIDICHATGSESNPFTTTPVALDGLNGHGDHEDDIIPPNPDLPEGLNWTQENIKIWENDCRDQEQTIGDFCEPQLAWANEVVDNVLGTKKNTSAITGARADSSHALGSPDATTGPDDGFYSLGQNGWITLKFDGVVMNGTGDDLTFHEVTNGRSTYPQEKIDVEVSQDGTNWHPIGSVTNQDNMPNGIGSLDLGSLEWISHVRITDTTDFSPHDNSADGYDLDAVGANQLCPAPEPCEEGFVLTITPTENGYEFECVQSEIEIEECTVSIFSDETNTVSEYADANAEALTFVHPGWTASIPGATWIWSDDPVVNPSVETIRTFEKEFAFNGPVTSAILDVAADNSYEVYINDVFVAEDTGEYNYRIDGQDQYVVTPHLNDGWNTIKFVVTNWEWPTQDPQVNPAGLLYSLHISGTDEDCAEEPPTGMIQGRKFNDLNANGTRQGGQGENWLDGWMIRLYDQDWNEIDSMETGDDSTPAGNVANGQYRFVDLDLGTYYVCEVQQDGWVQTRPTLANNRPEHPQEDDNICYRVVINEAGQSRTGRTFGNYEAIGQIAGLVYNDINNNASQDGGEPPFEGWEVWLLTKNSPYTIRAIENTDGTGSYLFENLPFGTYYVCQEVPEGWTQTELNYAGTSGIATTPAVGDVLEIDDAEVAQFCYEVILTFEEPEANERDFGNFSTVAGVIDVKNPDGSVLGDTDGQVLAETGSPTMWSILLGALLLSSSLALTLVPVRKK